jgi:hypothetical protein
MAITKILNFLPGRSPQPSVFPSAGEKRYVIKMLYCFFSAEEGDVENAANIVEGVFSKIL